MSGKGQRCTTFVDPWLPILGSTMVCTEHCHCVRYLSFPSHPYHPLSNLIPAATSFGFHCGGAHRPIHQATIVCCCAPSSPPRGYDTVKGATHFHFGFSLAVTTLVHDDYTLSTSSRVGGPTPVLLPLRPLTPLPLASTLTPLCPHSSSK